jgi:hypothetical protein
MINTIGSFAVTEEAGIVILTATIVVRAYRTLTPGDYTAAFPVPICKQARI